mmetsp:Transcript_3476/g.14346  ORF Transcript_3476/g.14346 Transcript_3476/m.14346 type:complete len:241 (+) Transcript_3476:424-1146(+)
MRLRASRSAAARSWPNSPEPRPPALACSRPSASLRACIAHEEVAMVHRLLSTRRPSLTRERAASTASGVRTPARSMRWPRSAVARAAARAERLAATAPTTKLPTGGMATAMLRAASAADPTPPWASCSHACRVLDRLSRAVAWAGPSPVPAPLPPMPITTVSPAPKPRPGAAVASGPEKCVLVSAWLEGVRDARERPVSSERGVALLPTDAGPHTANATDPRSASANSAKRSSGSRASAE